MRNSAVVSTCDRTIKAFAFLVGLFAMLAFGTYRGAPLFSLFAVCVAGVCLGCVVGVLAIRMRFA
jgi:ABC-type uncharacterized transport system permease subunit